MPVPLIRTQECVLNSNFVGLAPQPSTLSPKLPRLQRKKCLGKPGFPPLGCQWSGCYDGLSGVYKVKKVCSDCSLVTLPYVTLHGCIILPHSRAGSLTVEDEEDGLTETAGLLLLGNVCRNCQQKHYTLDQCHVI